MNWHSDNKVCATIALQPLNPRSWATPRSCSVMIITQHFESEDALIVFNLILEIYVSAHSFSLLICSFTKDEALLLANILWAEAVRVMSRRPVRQRYGQTLPTPVHAVGFRLEIWFRFTKKHIRIDLTSTLELTGS